MNPARRSTAAVATAVVLSTGSGLLAASPASADVSCTSPVYKRQFFANTTLSGTPKKTDCDDRIDQSWGTGAPASGLPSNDFSVRWTVTRDFGSGGPFALSVATQDGIRVYLDGTRKVDLWKNVSTTQTKTVNVTVPSGKHTLRVDYVNWTGTANVKFDYLPRTSATVDTVRPLVPTAAAVSYDTVGASTRFSWAKNKEMDLAGYRVYRRLKGASYGSTPLATTTSTSYTDTGLPVTGATYYYEVRAYDKAGNASSGTADLGVTTVDRTAPAAPGGLRLADHSYENGVVMAWSQVADAASYRLYRATTASGTYTRIGSTDQLSYRDASTTAGVDYHYRVTAVDAAGNESARSDAVRGWRRDDTPPSAVTGLTLTPTEYGFALKWDANPTPDLGRYVVYAGELLGDEEEQVCSVHQVEWLSADTTSYDYATLPDGEERCLFVDAVDDNWNSHYEWTRSPHIVTATELDTTPSVPTPEGSPLELEASAAQTAVSVGLSWNTQADATGYQVYRWSPDTKAYEKLATTTQLSYEDYTAATGATHYYWVTAMYADGTESAPGADYAILRP